MRQQPAKYSLLPATAAEHCSGGIAGYYLLAGDMLRHRKPLSDLAVKPEEEGLGHIRHMLPRLRCSTGVREALNEALRPRFDGRDTLHSSGQPVRAAVDLAVADPNAGLYLTGWIYDPAEVVSSVLVRNEFGFECRIDANWTRVPRLDVTEAFQGDRALPPLGPALDDLHGFAAHAASLSADQHNGLHLDVTFRDGSCGFLPVLPFPATDVARSRLLAAVDLHKPCAFAIVENHLAPFFLRLRRRASPTRSAEIPRVWNSVIVVPLDDPLRHAL